MIRLRRRLHEQILSAAVLLRLHLPCAMLRRKATDSEALHQLHMIEILGSSAKSEPELVLTKRKKSRRRRNRIWDGDLECGEGEGGNHVEVKKDSFLISEIDLSRSFFSTAEKRYHLRKR